MGTKLDCFISEHIPGTGSIGEQIIADYLERTGIDFKREVVFSDLRFLRFDFYIPRYRLAIEFDGRQHFGVVKDFGDTRMKLKQRNLFDRIKNRFIFGNGGVMIRVKYSDDTIGVLKSKIAKYFGNDCKLLEDEQKGIQIS